MSRCLLYLGSLSAGEVAKRLAQEDAWQDWKALGIHRVA